MTLGTAKIEAHNGQVILTYRNVGSFLKGEQTFGDSREGWTAALRFCRERGLRVAS